MSYAKSTGVSVARSRVEIEDTINRYGAEEFSLSGTVQSASLGGPHGVVRVREWVVPVLNLRRLASTVMSRYSAEFTYISEIQPSHLLPPSTFAPTDQSSRVQSTLLSALRTLPFSSASLM